MALLRPRTVPELHPRSWCGRKRGGGGGWHPCVDFRLLNAVTCKDSYPLPRIDDFDLIDFRSEYWQVELAAEAQPAYPMAWSTGGGRHLGGNRPSATPSLPHSLVLRWVHGAAGAGNSKTVQRLRQRFYWLGCRQDAELHIHCCNVCMAQKGPIRHFHAPL